MKKGFRILKFKKDSAIFEIKNVSKSFDGRPILKKLSLKVFPGECVGISRSKWLWKNNLVFYVYWRTKCRGWKNLFKQQIY